MKCKYRSVCFILFLFVLTLAQTQEVKARFKQDEFRIIYDVVWSPNGQILAVVSDEPHNVTLLNTNFEKIRTVGEGVGSISWSPNGSQLAIADRNGISIFNVNNPQTPPIFIDTTLTSFPPLAWHPTNDKLAVALGNFIQFFDPITGQQLESIAVHEPNSQIYSLCWHSNGIQILSAGNDKTVRILNTSTQQTVTFTQPDFVNIAVWSPNFDKFATDSNNSIIIWDVSAGQQSQVLQGHTSRVYDIAWSNSGLASSSFDQSIRIWDPSNGTTIEIVETGFRIPGMVWSPNGQQLIYWGQEEAELQIAQPSAFCRAIMR